MAGLLDWLACWLAWHWPAGWLGLEGFQCFPFAWPLAELPGFLLSLGLRPEERVGSARGGEAPSLVAGQLDWLARWLAWPWPAGWLGLGRLLGRLAWATLAGWLAWPRLEPAAPVSG